MGVWEDGGMEVRENLHHVGAALLAALNPPHSHTPILLPASWRNI